MDKPTEIERAERANDRDPRTAPFGNFARGSEVTGLFFWSNRLRIWRSTSWCASRPCWTWTTARHLRAIGLSSDGPGPAQDGLG